MFKKSVVLVIVMVMLVSFSAAVLATDNTDENQENLRPIEKKSGVVISVDENDKVKKIEFLKAVPDHAEENGKSDRPDNPIIVAGD